MREISILDIIKYYLKNLEIVLLITMLSLLFGIFYVERNFIPVYKESTTIILGKSDEKENEEISSSTITLYDSLIHNYLKLLESKKLLSNVKEDLNLSYSIKELSEKIEYSVSDSSQLIEISVTDKNDDLAVEICNQIVKELQNQVYEIYGIKNITIVDEAKANQNQVYTPSFIIMVFTILGFLFSSFMIIMKFVFNNQLTSLYASQIKEIHLLGKTICYSSNKTMDIELELSEKIENDFRMIRANLLENLEEEKVIMITSVNKNNNKSYLTYHLANSLRKSDKTVLIIDTNAKDGLITQKFFKDKEGIIEVLNKKKELSAVINKINQVDIIPLGNKEKIDLLSSSEFQNILDNLKKQYDYILIETPPYKNNFESIFILNLVDSIIMLNKPNQNKMKDLQLLVQKVEKKPFGMVFIQEKRKKNPKKKFSLPKISFFSKKKEKTSQEEFLENKISEPILKKENHVPSKEPKKNQTKNNTSKPKKENKDSSKQKTKKSIGVDKSETNQ